MRVLVGKNKLGFIFTISDYSQIAVIRFILICWKMNLTRINFITAGSNVFSWVFFLL